MYVSTDNIDSAPSLCNPLPECTPMLKQLHPSGTLGGTERCTCEAIEHKLTYPEFLASVIKHEDLHDPVAELYERAATIISSDLGFSEWIEAIPNKLLGTATLDRLHHRAYRVILDGRSYQSPKPVNDAHP